MSCASRSSRREKRWACCRSSQTAGSEDVDNRDTRRLAEMAARQIGLTLSNIRLRESLRDQSIRDPMTKAFNRRHLETVFEKEMAKAIRYGRPLSIAMLDIDHFKRYNDTHGHQAGDAALIAVTQHIQSKLRESDWLFRYGGEEFLILFSESGSADAAARLDQIRNSVSMLSIANDGVALPHVTISCGAAGLGEDAETFEALVSAADAALYEAKNAGRNQVRRASELTAIGKIA
ncbi:GGDEF domain-containing protein [Rhizobium sp. G21]|uniref:GGDEF domain-containing protein n=1 Tax=Rhizobium sp. G21 TaxID=2758439 RepID=UPI0016035B48|nr:GGDEF domain-containing protein [Rhizobium sp. G21]MBB1248382.1 GGDEF domain-containing protein [Rhizobium sp. G21]